MCIYVCVCVRAHALLCRCADTEYIRLQHGVASIGLSFAIRQPCMPSLPEDVNSQNCCYGPRGHVKHVLSRHPTAKESTQEDLKAIYMCCQGTQQLKRQLKRTSMAYSGGPQFSLDALPQNTAARQPTQENLNGLYIGCLGTKQLHKSRPRLLGACTNACF
eukprot:1157336-Pelagomonas_calceolata.AAC.2